MKKILFFLLFCLGIAGCSPYPQTTIIHSISVTFQQASPYEERFKQDIEDLPQTIAEKIDAIVIEDIPRSYTSQQTIHLSASNYQSDMVLHEGLHAWLFTQDTGNLQETIKEDSFFSGREMDESLVEVCLWYLKNPDGLKKEKADLYEQIVQLNWT